MRVAGAIYFEPSPDAMTEEAIVTPSRCALDWKVDTQRWCIIADSRDGGSAYMGHIGNPEIETDSRVTLFRFASKATDEVILSGTISRPKSSEEFLVMVHLFPEAKQERRSRKKL